MTNLLTVTPDVQDTVVADSLLTATEAPEATTAAADAAETLTIGFWDLFMHGGWLMWVLVALAGVMIFIFIERFLAIRKATRVDNNFMNRIRDYISDGRIDAALDACRRTDTPIARMIEKGISRMGRPVADVQAAIIANQE